MNPVGRPRLLTDAELNRAKALVRSGSSRQQVARLLDVSKPTLNRRLLQPYKQRETNFCV